MSFSYLHLFTPSRQHDLELERHAKPQSMETWDHDSNRFHIWTRYEHVIYMTKWFWLVTRHQKFQVTLAQMLWQTGSCHRAFASVWTDHTGTGMSHVGDIFAARVLPKGQCIVSTKPRTPSQHIPANFEHLLFHAISCFSSLDSCKFWFGCSGALWWAFANANVGHRLWNDNLFQRTYRTPWERNAEPKSYRAVAMLLGNKNL